VYSVEDAEGGVEVGVRVDPLDGETGGYVDTVDKGLQDVVNNNTNKLTI
jgi:hypothetical protein